MTVPTDYARGDYQIALLTGQARWSGSDLVVAPPGLLESDLLARLQCAGFACDVRDYLNANRRTIRVLYVDGVAVSATS